MRPEIIPHQTEHKLISDEEKGITIEETEKRIEQMKKTLHNIVYKKLLILVLK